MPRSRISASVSARPQPTVGSSLRAAFLNSSGQWESQRSGSKSASRIAREEASGRRAHQRCSVEGCPWRIDFSRMACRDTAAIGKFTSARRLHSLGIIVGKLWPGNHGVCSLNATTAIAATDCPASFGRSLVRRVGRPGPNRTGDRRGRPGSRPGALHSMMARHCSTTSVSSSTKGRRSPSRFPLSQRATARQISGLLRWPISAKP